MASTATLKVHVLAGRNLIGKNSGNKSDPYCELVLLDDQGVKLGKPQTTRVIKTSLNPEWDQFLEFPSIPSSFSGLTVRCWDKHKIRSDKFMGQFTIKFNTTLLASSEKPMDDWFPLQKRKTKEDVSGDIHLQIHYITPANRPTTTSHHPAVVPGTTSTTTTTITRDERSATLIGGEPVTEVKTSPHFNTDDTNHRLKNSTHVIVHNDPDVIDDVVSHSTSTTTATTTTSHHPHHPNSGEVTSHTIVGETSSSQSNMMTSSSSSVTSSSYEKIREGPSTITVEKLNGKEDKDLTFSNKNLIEIINNNSSNSSSSTYGNGGAGGLQYAVGNVRVNGGRWFYEVRIVSPGQIHIGWCTTNHNPRNNTGTSWCFDGSKQQKIQSPGNSQSYGEYCVAGDVIGVALDVENKTIQYYKNGKDMGIAFTNVSPPGIRLCPFFALSKRTKITVNFGKDAMGYPNTPALTEGGFHILHCFLSEKEMDQLFKLFLKYKDIGNAALLAEETNTNNNNDNNDNNNETNNSTSDVNNNNSTTTEIELKDSIAGVGLMEFCKDLGVVEDDDPLLMILAFHLKCEKVWEISREEFMNGFPVYGCATLDKIRAKCKEWRETMKNNPQQFKQVYNFVFDYLREDKKILLVDEAILAWNIILKDRPWPLFNDFVDFLQEEKKKSISRDAWQQMWHFMQSYPVDLSQYDAMSSWPIIYDEFVEWMEKQGKK